ncbi:uncharacterized protein BX663DRAFT_493038 [Cokeromyces recurvatus]|uniref:uncharacterized protein n=1 Tax=Cokeromyces recurvatus TaxID=90255 RepID=UPI00221E9A2A|nr:uncharacterized protein BX663DRAFT_493038 [Cokeromyces recurvatus]KAI7908116.1 hypothetical protein BX663DRAFT_493038 [Cokeromyces recurvatus]
MIWTLSNYLTMNPTLLNSIATHWKTDDQLLDLIVLLKSLFGADPGLTTRPKGKPIFNILWNIFINLLDQKQTHKIQNNALDLLPVFICLDDDFTIKIKEKISLFFDYYYSDQSKYYLKKGTTRYNEFITILDKLLETMTTFKSVVIFNLLLSTFAKLENHTHEEAIKRSLEKFSKTLGKKSFLEVTGSCLSIFKDENYLLQYRQSLLDVVIILLTNSDENNLVSFYERNISFIMGVVQKKLTDCIKDQPIELTIKSCYKNRPIDKIWLDSEENIEKRHLQSDIISTFTSMLRTASPSLNMEKSEHWNAQLKYNQAVFNTTAAFALLLADKENFYNSFFCEESRTNSYIWRKIIDITQPLSLKLELDQPLIKSKLEGIKSIMGYNANNEERNISYMSSIALTGSSLTQSSFSEMVLEESQHDKQEQNAKDKYLNSLHDEDTQMEETSDKTDFNDMEYDEEFEVDILNQNSVMRSLTEVVKKLNNEVCCPNNYSPDTMPTWMKGLLGAFNSEKGYSEDNGIIIQAYIVKLITNFPLAFEKYARHWIGPLMDFIIKGDMFGTPINYLIQDLCIILIVWGRESEIPLSTLRECHFSLSRFLKYLIKNAYHESPRIMKSNIQIIKGIFENYGKFCAVPTRAIYEQFHHIKGEEAKNIIGLQITGIIYGNGIAIYDPYDRDLLGLSELTFYTDMAKNINYKDRKSMDISSDAAELMGWTLKILKDKNDPLSDQLHSIFKKMLIDLGNSGIHSAKHFLKCMNRIYLHDLELGKELLSTVTQRLIHFNADEKVLALNFISVCWNNDDTTYYYLRRAGLSRMLTNRDENLQLASLKALNTLFDSVDGEELNLHLKQLEKVFPNHKNTECRFLFFAFLKKAYKSRKLNRSQLQTAKARIYRGLIDKDEKIAADMFDFIKSEFQLDDDILSTLLKITSNMYLKETEDIYLLCATRVILSNTKKTYDFNQPIFENPLDTKNKYDVGYKKIDTSWYSTSSMTPMFVSTSSKTLNVEDLEFELRKTQSLFEFSATQGNGPSLLATYNPTSQGSMSNERYDDKTIDDETHLGENIQNRAIKKEKRYFTKRFFVQSKNAISRFHADRNEQLQKKLRHLLNTRKEAMEKKVTLSRSYRAGEIPDVQISRKELLQPLEILATADFNISRLLYSSLAISIVNEFEQMATDDESNNYKQAFFKSIETNLKISQSYFTPTIGAFLRIIFELNAPINNNLLREVSHKSYNHHIGIAILEKQLDYGDFYERPAKRTNTLTPTKDKWIYLALLYQNIDELEIFENIYLSNVSTNEFAKNGIKSQIKGDYAIAFNQFDSAVSQSGVKEDIEYYLWQEQMLYCRTQLGQWEFIARDVKDQIHSNWSSLWGENEDPYLEYFIRSASKLKEGWILDDVNIASPELVNLNKDTINPVYSFLDNAYENEIHKEKILDRFAFEWSIIETLRKNYNKGRLFINKAYNAMLSSWTTLHPLAHTSRLARLAHLQKAVELDDYLKLHKDFEDGEFNKDKIEYFIKTLTSRYPDIKTDRMDIWDDILQTRFEFIDDLNKQDSMIIHDMKPFFCDAKIKFTSAVVDAALEQGNLTVLSKLLKLLKEMNATYEADITLIRYYQYECLNRPPEEKSRYIARAIIKSLTSKPPTNSTEHEIYKWGIITANSFDIKNLESYIENAETFVNYLEKTGYDILAEVGKLNITKTSERAEYLWRLGKYCDESLHVLQDAVSILQPEFNPLEYCKIVIKSYFHAIEWGYKDSNDYFPRLLELLELYPESGPIFKTCSLELNASWKYIRWIPQLISSMASPIATYTMPILERIAKDYPKALYYPFQMSCEFYELKKGQLSKETCEVIERIMNLIRSPIMERFAIELKRLIDPDHIIKDFIEYIKSILLEEDTPQIFIESKYKEFYQLVLNNYSESLGTIPKRIAASHARTFIRYFGENGSKISKLTKEQLEELGNYYKTKIRETIPNDKNRLSLKSYSPWLSSFKNIEHDDELEIPGQYHGLARPYPELHSNIASIDARILMMASMRKPKRITIYGTDEKEYKFLVKGGEDLRLDERIEQLFNIMNSIIKRNAFCSSQNIQISTYKVIPMASNLGLIEWVSHTLPLRACIEKHKSNLLMQNAARKYRRWIISNHHPLRPNENEFRGYYAAFAQPRDKIVYHFEAIANSVPNTMLKDYLFQLASSPEAFLFLRKDFAYSIACISIYGYILGIGDRHLDNFLLDEKSGRLIPIDFGYAFGAASELIPIPEIVPFRLTRQLIGVLDPLGISGILEDAMINILSVIQAEKELLLNIMRQEDDESLKETSYSIDKNIEWYPQKKIDTAKRKLNGENPANIIVSELMNGHSNEPWINNIKSIAKGVPGVDIRANIGNKCKNVNEQVKCLINLATDSRVLGVMYRGWQPYL